MKLSISGALVASILIFPVLTTTTHADPSTLPPPSGPLPDAPTSPGSPPPVVAPIPPADPPPAAPSKPVAPKQTPAQPTPANPEPPAGTKASPSPTPEDELPMAQEIPSPTPPPLDAAAVEFLDKVASKYKALQGLSLIYTTKDKRDKTTDVTTGNFAFKRPNLARLEGKLDKGQFGLYVDTQKFIVLAPTKEYRKMVPPPAGSIPRVIGAMPSAAAVFLQVLVDGANPARMQGGGNWSSVTLLPVEAGTHLQGVSLVATPSDRLQSLVFNLYFDRTDLLLRRGVAKASSPEGEFSNDTVFTKLLPNPTFRSGAFSFVPGPDNKEASAQPPANPTYWNKSLKVGGKPIALQGADLTGQARPLEAYKGKVLLLDFWATWCGPCIQELPGLKAAYNKYHSKGFEILGISLDEDKTELTSFIKANKMSWPQLFDGKNFNGVNPKAYGLEGIPFTLLIGKNGNIRAINPRGPELEKAVEAALNSKN